MNPFALRMMLKGDQLREWAFLNLPIVFREEMTKRRWSSSDIVVYFYSLFARAMHLVMLHKISNATRAEMGHAIIKFHEW